MASESVTMPRVDGDDLAQRAIATLEANQRGDITIPSPRLYPHQWSWDAAFIAIGYARYDQARAEQELRALFRGQWSNGLLPHIVFADDAGAYFPGPEFWQTERSPYAPRRPRTTGIVQPPVHATAAWQIYRHATDRVRAVAFLEEILPGLAAWHAYLHRERTRGDDGLVEVWHPWELMDNSPLWDEVFARMTLAPDEVPDYRRVDVDVAEPSERPSDAEYDRYAYLVRLFRDHSYDPAPIRESTPFAFHTAMFNAILVQADRDLARIAEVAGADPAPFHEWADRTAAGIDASLWDEEHGTYVDLDLRTGQRVGTRTAAGFTPLYAGVPDAARARRLVDSLLSFAARLEDDSWVLPTVSLDDPSFRPTLYWRGPIWINLNWLLLRGLERYGFDDEARQLRTSLVSLIRRSGFWEHYSPETGRGHGVDQFAWSAALVLDLLGSDAGVDER